MIKARYYDIINNKQEPEEEQKSGDEIVREFVARAGLELV